MTIKVVAIKELLWSWHPIPSSWIVVPASDLDTINSADVLVQANIKQNKKERKLGKFYNIIEDSNKPWICVESAVFRRNMPHPDPGKPGKSYHRFSWYSYFQDEGYYNNINCPDDRWKQVKADQQLEVKDWRTKGEYVLLTLQRPGDSSLKNLLTKHGSYKGFLEFTINEIKKHTDRKILVRPHPSRRNDQLKMLADLNLPGIEISNNVSAEGFLSGATALQADFDRAWAVVGFNSNALTESIMEGIPTFSMCPSSMAWDCSNKDLSTIESPLTFDRQQWLNNLSYCQWREDECIAGLPWEHLKPLYPNLLKNH
jgi:hypothetical protein|tara:strand:+ start:648 stop:1589 length:942 start_codon:yes stop_codon:yes gene_type:complete